MKKTLLLACTIVSFATLSHAQIKKGSVLLGGSVGIDKSTSQANNSEDSKVNTTYFSPTVGLAVKDNWVVGLSAGISNYKNKPSGTTSKQTIEDYSGGVFVRRYSPLGKGFYLYGNGNVSYDHYSNKQVSGTDNETNYSSNGVSLSVSPGIAYAVSKRFHLEAYLNQLFNVGYTTSKIENVYFGGTSTTKGKNFNVGANLNTIAPLTVGFRFVLGK